MSMLTPSNTEAAAPAAPPWWARRTAAPERAPFPGVSAAPAPLFAPAAPVEFPRATVAPHGPQREQIAAPTWEEPASSPWDQFGRNLQTLAVDMVNKEQLPSVAEKKPAMQPPHEPGPLAPGLRGSQMARSYEMTPEEYSALSDRQQATVQFNTGLLEAAQQDEAAGGSEATKNYLSRLGIETKSQRELDEFLQLDRLVSEKILEKLGDPKATQDAASTMRWARGDIDAAGDARRLSNAQSIGELAAAGLTASLQSTGQRSLTASEALPGYGATAADNVIRQAYTNMVDSRFDLTPDDVAEGIAQANAALGTKVTPQQVWDFLGRQLEATEFSREGDTPGRLSVPETDEATGEPITPLDIAEIRRRYGL